MARKIDLTKPLSADDIAYLKARHPLAYVQRLVDLAGQAEETPEEAENSPETGEEGAEGTDAAETPEDAGDGSEEDEEGDGDEDLIGDGEGDDAPGEVFDVIGSTEAEVKSWAESADDEAKAAALATEQAREDRDPRKGVVTLLS